MRTTDSQNLEVSKLVKEVPDIWDFIGLTAAK